MHYPKTPAGKNGHGTLLRASYHVAELASSHDCHLMRSTQPACPDFKVKVGSMCSEGSERWTGTVRPRGDEPPRGILATVCVMPILVVEYRCRVITLSILALTAITCMRVTVAETGSWDTPCVCPRPSFFHGNEQS